MSTVKICEVDVPNKNGRVYPRKLLESLVGTKEVFGGIGMQGGVSPDKASHSLSNLRIENGFLVGNMAVLKTPEGQILSDLLKAQINVDFRTSATCTFGENGEIENYTPISVNAVSNGA